MLYTIYIFMHANIILIYIQLLSVKIYNMYTILITASRSIQTQDDNEYDIITAYVEDNNSLHPDNDLHSGPPSIKVSN